MKIDIKAKLISIVYNKKETVNFSQKVWYLIVRSLKKVVNEENDVFIIKNY